MNKLRNNRIIFLLLTFSLTVGGFLVSVLRSNSAEVSAESEASPKKDIRVISKVEGVRIVAVKTSGSLLSITVRNELDSDLTSFYLTSKKFSHHIELAYSDFSPNVPPQTEFDLMVDFDQGIETHDLVLNAVLLSGGGARGNAAAIELMKSKRLGEKLQLIADLKIVDAHISPANSQTQESKETLKDRIASAPLGTDDTNQFAKQGRNSARQRVLHIVERMPNANVSERIRTFISRL